MKNFLLAYWSLFSTNLPRVLSILPLYVFAMLGVLTLVWIILFILLLRSS